MSDNSDLIIEFCQAWSRLDPVELAAYFTEDGIYHNMPAGPVEGRDEIETFIRGFTATWTKTNWDLLNVLDNGNIVIAERLDRTQAGEKKVDLPCTGVFEIRDGRIAVWRDYFDMGTYARGMS
jgi:limonene-1,2-epoxide hydrolase